MGLDRDEGVYEQPFASTATTRTDIELEHGEAHGEELLGQHFTRRRIHETRKRYNREAEKHNTEQINIGV